MALNVKGMSYGGTTRESPNLTPHLAQDKSAWEIQSEVLTKTLDELYNKVERLGNDFYNVLTPEHLAETNNGEMVQKAESPVIQHLVDSADRVEKIIRMLEYLKSRSQV